MHLFIGSHPDDLEISCIGYIIKLLKKNEKVFLYVVSKVDQIRFDEQLTAFEKLKEVGDFHFFIDNFEVRTFESNSTAIRHKIENIITENSVKIVYAPFGKDTHIDHRTVSQVATDASRKISLIYYEAPTCYEFEPNFFVVLEKQELEKKVELFKIHKSQYIKENNNYFYNKIISTADFRGISVYEDYAESYRIGKLKIGV